MCVCVWDCVVCRRVWVGGGSDNDFPRTRRSFVLRIFYQSVERGTGTAACTTQWTFGSGADTYTEFAPFYTYEWKWGCGWELGRVFVHRAEGWVAEWMETLVCPRHRRRLVGFGKQLSNFNIIIYAKGKPSSLPLSPSLSLFPSSTFTWRRAGHGLWTDGPHFVIKLADFASLGWLSRAGFWSLLCCVCVRYYGPLPHGGRIRVRWWQLVGENLLHPGKIANAPGGSSRWRTPYIRSSAPVLVRILIYLIMFPLACIRTSVRLCVWVCVFMCEKLSQGLGFVISEKCLGWLKTEQWG